MTRRKLTDDEIDLWQKVVKHAERLHADRDKKAGDHAVPPAPKPKPKPQRAPNAALPHFEVGSQARDKAMGHDLKPSPGRKLATAPLRMDEKAYRRMKRGKLKPEGKLDLHGMRIDAAHGALTRFILTAQAADKRLVLVITGKGKDRDVEGPMPVPRGVLRHQVPQWLTIPPLAQAVLQVTPAHLSHGGEGAYYVYLRRNR
ncbi:MULTISPECIES: Smr/MutS family protein [unclassified Epibacterium]|jgi:DNA-nicking Smr family endonuclease|uniref:Smr/MutS family protein n=1 Tax=unclassified Epibacterium TaxID=2639179 RepID=UPI001EF60AFA|nr:MULTISPECIES: Smr/MutS family protein [unclassified Epibacterium]MCG7623744.1 Smr/MutS family protein [Epibacterium sp. Ofav1-8]MCG7628275.1 Smr/MutS family protein [Epibacterium sp. MM17-32]